MRLRVPRYAQSTADTATPKSFSPVLRDDTRKEDAKQDGHYIHPAKIQCIPGNFQTDTSPTIFTHFYSNAER